MGYPPDVARGSLRITLGRENTRADIDALMTKLPPIVEKLRRLSPLQRSPVSS
jgi:cysteine desulfurase